MSRRLFNASRCALFYFIITIVFYSLLIRFFLLTTKNSMENPISNYNNYEKNSCILPKINPFDSSVLLPYVNPFRNHPIPNHFFNCTNEETKKMTQLTNGILSLATELASDEYCEWREIMAVDENRMKFGGWRRLKMNMKVNVREDFVETRCLNDNGTLIFAYVHIQVVQKKNDFIKEDGEHKSVLIMVFDSISFSNSVRSMSKTLQVLKNVYGAYQFPFLNKVAENTRPNAKAIFAGLRIEHFHYGNGGIMAPEVMDDCHSRLNVSHSLFSLYRERRYATFMGDDWMTALTFPNCTAFDGVPTDHFSRPLILRTTEEGDDPMAERVFKQFIYRGECKQRYHLIVEYLQRFLETYKDIGKFASIWLTRPWHDDLNGFFHADQFFADLLSNLRPLLINSWVFVLADHGKHFGPFRATSMGALDDNNPMLIVAPPFASSKETMDSISAKETIEILSSKETIDSISAKETIDILSSKETIDILSSNTQSHLSHFDVYATLLDILRLPNRISDRSQSLFSPIFPQRDCDTMQIPRLYCLCDFQWSSFNGNKKQIQSLGQLLIASINNRLITYNASLLCARLILFRIDSIVQSNRQKQKQNLVQSNRQKQHLVKIRVFAKPGYGLFEAIAQRLTISNMNDDDEQWLIDPQIHRVNEYGSQGDCMINLERSLKPLCLCL